MDVLQDLHAPDGVLGLQVGHLPGDHARRPRRPGQLADQLHRQRRIVHPVGEDLEGERQEAVARQNRGRLVKGLVAGRPAAPQIVVVHRRQIVVDERIGVDHLDRGGGDPCVGVVVSGDQLAAPQDQGRANPLARRESV